jgi:hypothetical protein
MKPEESKMLTDLHRAVCGDEEYGNDGLIARQSRLESEVEALRDWKKWLGGLVVGVNTAIAGVITYFKYKS